jgi:hypothetical protein
MLKHETLRHSPRILLVLAILWTVAACQSVPVAKPSSGLAAAPKRKPPDNAPPPPLPIMSGGEFHALLSARSGLQAHLRLSLLSSGEAELKAELRPGEPPLIRTGSWLQSSAGQINIVLAAENGAALERRVQWVLSPYGKDLDTQSTDVPGFESAPLRLFHREEIRPPTGGAFVGPTWIWLADSIPGEHGKSDRSAQFSLQLKEDGWFNFRTDCGEGSGMFETYGQEIALAAVQVPGQRCDGDSAHGHFLKALEDAGRFRVSDDRLFFDTRHVGKTMVFYKHP